MTNNAKEVRERGRLADSQDFGIDASKNVGGSLADERAKIVQGHMQTTAVGRNEKKGADGTRRNSALNTRTQRRSRRHTLHNRS